MLQASPFVWLLKKDQHVELDLMRVIYEVTYVCTCQMLIEKVDWKIN
jgi:hypothetical protein